MNCNQGKSSKSFNDKEEETAELMGGAPPSSCALDLAVGNFAENPVILTTALSHMRDGKLL